MLAAFLMAAIQIGFAQVSSKVEKTVNEMVKKYENVKGIDEKVKTLPLCLFGAEKAENGISGSDFPYGSTGMISLGDGLFYFSKHFLDKENGHGSDICLFNFDGENFTEI